MRSARWLMLIAALSGGVLAVGYATWLRPRLLAGRQIRNHASCQVVDAWLTEFHREKGEFPQTLASLPSSQTGGGDALRDGWGQEFFYWSDGAGFLLVSYGRDGKPDGTDYHGLRASANGLGPQASICGEYDADEVLSDRGWHRVCGK